MEFNRERIIAIGAAAAREEGIVEIGQFQFQAPIQEIGWIRGRFPRKEGMGVGRRKEDGSIETGVGHLEFFGKVVYGRGGSGEVGNEANVVG